MRLWRVGTSAHPLWSGEGARLHGARWNRPGLPAIYAGTSCAISVLEILAHLPVKRPPSASRFLTIDCPDDGRVETFDPAAHPGWDDLDDARVAQAFGSQWLTEARTPILLVPSVVTGGLDLNAVINPAHADFARLIVSVEAPLVFDPRLF